MCIDKNISVVSQDCTQSSHKEECEETCNKWLEGDGSKSEQTNLKECGHFTENKTSSRENAQSRAFCPHSNITTMNCNPRPEVEKVSVRSSSSFCFFFNLCQYGDVHIALNKVSWTIVQRQSFSLSANMSCYEQQMKDRKFLHTKSVGFK